MRNDSDASDSTNREKPVKERKPLTLKRKFSFSDPRDGFTVPVVVNEVMIQTVRRNNRFLLT